LVCWREKPSYIPIPSRRVDARRPEDLTGFVRTSGIECPLWVKSRHFAVQSPRPLWVISGHTQCKRARPLCPQQRPQMRISAKGHVCFTPESRHVRCNCRCPLWARRFINRSARRTIIPNPTRDALLALFGIVVVVIVFWFLLSRTKVGGSRLIGPVGQKPGSSSKIQKRWQQHALWMERSEGGQPCKRRYVGHFNAKLFR
jgi:hypothetical protein